MARDLFAEVMGAKPERDLFAEVMGDQPDPEVARDWQDTTRRADAVSGPTARERMETAIRDGTDYVSDHAPEDDWLTTGRKFFNRLAPIGKRVAGGALQGLIETAGGPPPNAPLTTAEADEMRREHEQAIATMRARGEVPGQKLFDDATADLAENGYNPGDSWAKKYVPMIAEGLVQMVPAIAGTLLTRNPGVGAGIVGGQAGADQYGESRASGRRVDQAVMDSTFMAASEAIGEKIPLGMMMKPGGRFLSRTLKQMGAEGLQEMFTETLQAGYDKGVLHPDMTWAEARQRIVDAGIVGAGMGAGMSAISAPFVRGDRPLAEQPLTTREEALLTPDDRASPIPDKIIARGKSVLDDVLAPEPTFAREGAPPALVQPESTTAEGGPFDAIFAELENEPLGSDPVGAPIPSPRREEEKPQPLRLPVEGRITSRFGQRDAPKAGASTNHGGIDIAVPEGTPVQAPAAGRVVAVGTDERNGTYVRVDHGNGRVTGYAHLSRADVKVGDTVEAGQAIALSGNTGNSTGPHLHYTVRENGVAVDPESVSFTGDSQNAENAIAPVDSQASPEENQGFVFDEGRDSQIRFTPIEEPAAETREPVFDEADPEKQIGWLDAATGKLAPLSGETAAPLAAVKEGLSRVERELRQSEAAATDKDGWARFNQSSGTKAVPRAEMPQIKAEHRGAMVNFLNARGISHAEETIPAADLKPTQAEFSPEKVAKAREYEGGDRAILVSSDGHVLDGHHQWLAARDAGQDVRAIRLNAPIDELLRVVPEMPSATTDEGAQQVSEPAPDSAISGVAFQTSSPNSGRGATEQSETTPAPLSKQEALKARIAAKRAQASQPDVITALAHAGGIKDEIGATGRPRHDLKKGRNLQRFVPRAGALIRSTGMTIDAAGEYLHERGYFGPPSTTPRPTEDQVLQLIERAAREKVYPAEAVEGVAQATREREADGEEQQVRAEVETVVEQFGLDVTADEIDAAIPLVRDIGAFGAIEHVIMQRGAADLRSAYDQTGASLYDVPGFDDIPSGDETASDATADAPEAPAPVERPQGRSGDAGEREASRQQSGEAPEGKSGSLGLDAAQPERSGLTDSQRSEIAARQQQGKARRGGQEAVSDQDGGLFSAERDQDALFSIEEPTIRLAGDELGKMPPYGQARIQILRSRAVAYFDKHFKGRTITASDGKPVTFTSSGRGKSTARKGDVLLRMMPALEEIITKGEKSAVPERADRSAKAEMFSATVVLDGEPHKVGAIVLTDANGRRHYDLTFKQKLSIGPRAGAPGASPEAVSGPAMDGESDAGLNLFLLDEQNNNVRPDLGQIRDELLERLKGYGLADRVALSVVNRIVDATEGTAGRYFNRLIQVAMETSQDGAFTLDHEAVHAMRELGLFTAIEWRALVRLAESDQALMDSVTRRYAGPYGGDVEMMREEAVADLFASYQAKRVEVKGFARIALDKAIAFLRAVRELWTGRGYADGRAVLNAIADGTIGARETGEGRGARVSWKSRQPRLSIPAKGLPSPISLDATLPNDALVAESESRAQKFVDSWRQIGDRDPRAESAFDRWRTALQDRMLPVLRMQQAIEKTFGRRLRETENPYLAEELMSGRIGSRMERLTDDMVSPLFEAMSEAGVSVEEVEAYLYARHAPERNKRIAEINPEFAEGEGSGMTDVEAKEIMAAVERDPRRDAIKALAGRVDQLLQFAVDTRVEAGLLSQADADLWKKIYQHYVPLRGRAELDPELTSDRPVKGGSGITVKGKESRRAFGRKSRAADILAYSIMQAEEAVMRAETNRVARSFHDLAQASPDPVFWKVDKVTRKAVWNSSRGQVEYRSESRIGAEDAPYTVSLKIDGTEHRVTMNRDNPAAVRVADAMRNLTTQQFDKWVQVFGSVNRFLSTVNTSLNPEFVITNAFRDLQTAGINLAQYDVKGIISGTLRDYRKALPASVKGAFKKGEGEWADWYREFALEGGRVYFNKTEDLAGIRRRIERLKDAQGPLNARRIVVGAFNYIEAANSGVENAIRLSAYKNAREAGMSRKAAASLAKNLTVNFNRRGQYGPLLNSLYLFYNASVQGSAVLLSAARSRRVQKVLAGAVITGALLEIMNSMISDDDDDGEAYYDKISDFDKSRNLIVMIPGGGGEFIKIPLPYGYNAFFGIGRAAAAIGRGRDWKTETGNLLTTVVDAFNPVGGTESLLNLISPTIGDPVVDLQRNRDFADRPIMPDERQFGPKEPDAQRYWNSVGAHWKAITDFLSSATGGDDVRPGAVDVSPETLEYMFGFASGAAGSFVERNIDLGQKIIDGTVEANDISLYRKVHGSKPSWYDKEAFYSRIADVEQQLAYAKDYGERRDREGLRDLVDEKRDVLAMAPVVKAARKEMKAIRKLRGQLELRHDLGDVDDAAFKTATDGLKEREKAVITAFNTRWNDRMSAD